MATVTRRRVISASPAAIWEVLADFGALASWVPSITHSSLTTTRTEGPGTTRRVQAGRTVLLERVVDWQPNETVAYAIEGLPNVVRSAQNRWTMRPVGADTADTEVSITSTVDTGSRPPQKLVAVIVGRIMALTSDKLLAGLADRMKGPGDA